MEKAIHFTPRNDPSIRLEGILGLPTAALEHPPGVVLCHPHPLYGGSMDTPLIQRLYAELLAEGFITLRFNFRGVGRSQGQHAGGVREVEDVAGAVEFLANCEDAAPARIYIVGYSFGALVGLKYAPTDPRIAGVVAIGLPLYAVGEGFLADYRKPKLFIAGEKDPICPPPELYAFLKHIPQPWEVQTLPRADHLFLGYEGEVALRVAEAIRRWAQKP